MILFSCCLVGIYLRKALRFLSKQGHLQPHFHSKPQQPNTQLKRKEELFLQINGKTLNSHNKLVTIFLALTQPWWNHSFPLKYIDKSLPRSNHRSKLSGFSPWQNRCKFTNSFKQYCTQIKTFFVPALLNWKQSMPQQNSQLPWFHYSWWNAILILPTMPGVPIKQNWCVTKTSIGTKYNLKTISIKISLTTSIQYNPGPLSWTSTYQNASKLGQQTCTTNQGLNTQTFICYGMAFI